MQRNSLWLSRLMSRHRVQQPTWTSFFRLFIWFPFTVRVCASTRGRPCLFFQENCLCSATNALVPSTFDQLKVTVLGSIHLICVQLIPNNKTLSSKSLALIVVVQKIKFCWMLTPIASHFFLSLKCLNSMQIYSGHVAAFVSKLSQAEPSSRVVTTNNRVAEIKMHD